MSQYGASVGITLIRNKIRDELAAALAQVSSAFPDGIASYEKPIEPVFLFSDTEVYRCPAIFLLVDSFDSQKQALGQNFILDRYTVICSCVVENLNSREAVTLLAYRYQAALRIVLDQSNLVYNDGTADRVKIEVRVKSGQFSKEWINANTAASAGRGFRKEIALALSVEHAENFS